MDPDALQATLEAALGHVGAFQNSAVQVVGAVVPVVSDGPPEPKLAAAIAWLTFHGRMQPIEEFEYGADTWLQPILDRVMALKPDIPGPETLAAEGGLTLRL